MLSINTSSKNNRHINTGPRGNQAGKRVRNIIITVVVLLVLFIGGGVGYTWYMGKNSKVEIASVSEQADPLLDPVVGKRKMAPDAAVNVSVQTLTSPLEPGMNALITIKTNPEAKCTIKVIYDKTPSTDSGLVEKIADEYGVVNWTWTVEQTAPLGVWPVTVTCANEKKSGVVSADLKLEKKPVEATPAN